MCGRWFVAMSCTKARTISSLRMRRCSQRKNRTNCTPTGTSAARMVDQWMGMLELCEIEEVNEVKEIKEIKEVKDKRPRLQHADRGRLPHEHSRSFTSSTSS